MNKFLAKTFFIFSIIITSYVLLGFLADGKTDPFYLRFTSPKQHSLILGSSRAAQGIVSTILNDELDEAILEGEIYNYSFTVLHSPFGAVYLNAIKEKLSEKTKKGLFIISVDPWSISSRIDIDYPRESKLELAKISEFNSYPNYDYLRNAYQDSFFSLIPKKITPNQKMKLHNNGWLEMSIELDSIVIKKGSALKLYNYKTKKLPRNKISESRIFYLEKIIKLLKKHGKVILVRIPLDKRMLEIENMLDSSFNSKMKFIAEKNNIPYMLYKDDNYLFPDGNHLYKESGKKFSKLLAKDINQLFVNE